MSNSKLSKSGSSLVLLVVAGSTWSCTSCCHFYLINTLKDNVSNRVGQYRKFGQKTFRPMSQLSLQFDGSEISVG